MPRGGGINQEMRPGKEYSAPKGGHDSKRNGLEVEGRKKKA